jgi:isoleucyl-tRNA synthetase
VYQSVNSFCATELSALYVDILKDRMYCNSKDDPSRRAAQTVMHRILTSLIKLVAPIAPFTSEESWQFLGNKSSIHAQNFPDVSRKTEEVNKDLQLKTRWDSILDLRLRVNQRIEEGRRDKKIGKSLEAHVEIATNRPPLGTAAATSEGNADLEELFIVSKVVIKPTDDEETITVTRAEDHGMKKCVRCWKYWDHVGSHAEHPELCDRCTKVVLGL